MANSNIIQHSKCQLLSFIQRTIMNDMRVKLIHSSIQNKTTKKNKSVEERNKFAKKFDAENELI